MNYLTSLIVALAIVATSAAAFAHASSPLARKVYSVNDGWFLRTNFGAITSAAPDRFICEEAFLGGDRFFVVPLDDTIWVTFGDTSIQRTEDGCDFEKVATLPSRVEDVDAHPASQSVVYVSNGDASTGEGAGVWISADAGRTFDAVGTLDPAIYQITTVRFLDDSTVVVGSYERDADGAAHVVTIDVTSGQTTALELAADLTFPYVIAAGGGRIVFNARAEVQTVYVGTPEQPMLHARPQVAGESWPTGAAISDDGSRIYLAGITLGQGVEIAEWSDDELVWESQLSASSIGCVAARGGDFLACTSSAAGGDADLISMDAAGTMPLVLFSNIQGPVDGCPADSDVATVCPLVWPEIAPALGGEDSGLPMDNGPGSDEDFPDSEQDPADSAEEGGCATGSGPGGALGLVLFAAFVLQRRRFRRRLSLRGWS